MTNSIDRLLRDALGGRAADHPPTLCPDADIVAAFADDALTRDERSRVEAHVVQCVRCQAWLSALEKTRPPAPAHPWWRRRALTWLVPVAAAATALAIWADVTRHAGVAPSAVPSQTAHNDARLLEPAERREQQAVADEQKSQSATVAGVPTASRSASAARKPEPPGSRSESDQSAGARALADSAAAVPAPPPADTAADASTAAVPPLPSRPAAPVIAPQPSAGPTMAQRSGAAAAEARSQNAAPAATPSTLAESVESKARSMDRVLARQIVADSLIAFGDPSRRWRIADGVAQHSSDGGMTWQLVSTGVNVRMTAGASPSPAVCWLVGAAGTVVLSTDEGRTWQRLAFPESVDLASVRARDGEHAEIVTAEGRTFRTSDGGRTWSR